MYGIIPGGTTHLIFYFFLAKVFFFSFDKYIILYLFSSQTFLILFRNTIQDWRWSYVTIYSGGRTTLSEETRKYHKSDENKNKFII